MNFHPVSPVAIIAKAATITEVVRSWEKLRQEAKEHASDKIKLTNLGRQIGVDLQMLCGHEQMRLSFYEGIKAQLPETLTFEAVQKCIAVARAHPQKIETVEAAMECEQLVLLAVDVIDAPHRSGPQASHDSTPDTFVWSILASAKTRLENKLADRASWDDDMRLAVRKQFEALKAWVEKIEAEL